MARYLRADRVQLLAMMALGSLLAVVVPRIHAALTAPQEPITVGPVEATWSGDRRSIIIRYSGLAYRASCEQVVISRLLRVRNALPIPVGVTFIDADRAQRHLDAYRVISTESLKVHPDGVYRIDLPDNVASSDVLGLMAQASIPTDPACRNGYAGTYTLFSIAPQ